MSAVRTSAPELVEAVRRIGPELEAAARQAELERALPAHIAALLRELGLFWLKTPEELGGSELDPLAFCDVVEEVAYHDASAAWAVMVGNGTTGYLVGRLPDAGIAEMFPPGGPLPVVAGQFVRYGTVVPERDGYRVTGRWSFCSGIMHADWVAGAFRLDDEIRLFCVPRSEATVHDVWHVAGLQGTGSNDFSLQDHFVPASRTMLALDEPPKRGGPLFGQPVQTFVGNEMGPVAIGIARRAIDDMRNHAGRSGGGHRSALGDRVSFHKAIAQADAVVAAGRLLYRDVVVSGWEQYLRDGTVDPAEMDIGMARTTYAVDSCIDAIGQLFRYGGGRVLSLDHPMQRHLRNLIGVGQHIALSEENYERAGLALLP